MKHIFTFILLTLCISSYAQSYDSTEIKLTHAKDLFIRNLISSQEYEAMRAQILGIKPAPQQSIIVQQAKPLPKLDSISIERLNAAGGAAQGVGVFMIIGSSALTIASGAVIANNKGRPINALEVALPILSGILLIPGICLVVEGSKNKHKYRRYKESEPVKVGVSPTAMTMTF